MSAKRKQSFYPSDTSQRDAQVTIPTPTPSPLKAQTAQQKVYLKKLRNGHHDVLLVSGPAGTGKTYLATRFAIEQFQKGEVRKIVITRPNVGAGDDLGYLPGDINEKMAPWVAPIRDVFLEVFSPAEFKRMIDLELIEIVPLCFIRGRTFKNAYIIADESQNCSVTQMKALLTRIGEGSRMIVTGDVEQFDRVEGGISGFTDIISRFESFEQRLLNQNTPGLPDFVTGGRSQPEHRWERVGMIRLGRADIVRHPVIDDILEMYSLEA